MTRLGGKPHCRPACYAPPAPAGTPRSQCPTTAKSCRNWQSPVRQERESVCWRSIGSRHTNVVHRPPKNSPPKNATATQRQEACAVSVHNAHPIPTPCMRINGSLLTKCRPMGWKATRPSLSVCPSSFRSSCPPSLHRAALPSAQPVPSATVPLLSAAASAPCCRCIDGRALGCQATPVRRSVDALKAAGQKDNRQQLSTLQAACRRPTHAAISQAPWLQSQHLPASAGAPYLKPNTFLQAASADHSCTPPLHPHVAITLPSAEKRRSADTQARRGEQSAHACLALHTPAHRACAGLSHCSDSTQRSRCENSHT